MAHNCMQIYLHLWNERSLTLGKIGPEKVLKSPDFQLLIASPALVCYYQLEILAIFCFHYILRTMNLKTVGDELNGHKKIQLPNLQISQQRSSDRWQIFLYFKCEIDNEGLPREFLCFLGFFSTWHEAYMVRISKFSDQPFMMCHRQIKKRHQIFDFFYKEKYLTQNLGHFAPSKKGLNKIGSKIASQ